MKEMLVAVADISFLDLQVADEVLLIAETRAEHDGIDDVPAPSSHDEMTTTQTPDSRGKC